MFVSSVPRISNHNNNPKHHNSDLEPVLHPRQLFWIRKGDVVTATNFHERHQELATAVDIAEEQKEANKSLINVSD